MTHRTAARAAQVILVVLFLGTVVAQLLIPLVAAEAGRLYPEVAHLVVPYSVAAIAALVGVEVALGAVFRLAGLSAGGRVFARGALRWVDVVIGAALAVAALSAGVWVHLILIEATGGPGALLALTFVVVASLGVALLMAVMRGLLAAAIADRAELAEVI